MKKKLKLFASIATLCLTLAVFAFGVFSAVTVTYKTTGKVTYDIEDTYVDIETRVYSTAKKYNSNQTIKEDSEDFSEGGFELLDGYATTGYEGKAFNKVELSEGVYSDEYSSVTETEAPTPLELDLAYDINNDNAEDDVYSYFVVTKITNRSTIELYAYVDFAGENKYVAPENNYTYKISGYKTLPNLNDVVYVVFGMSLSDVTVPITDETGAFVYPVSVTLQKPENAQLGGEAQEEGILQLNSVHSGGVQLNGEEYNNVDLKGAGSVNLNGILLQPGQSHEIVMNVSKTSTTVDSLRMQLTYPNGLPTGIEINSTGLFLTDDTAKDYKITITNVSSTEQYLDFAQFNVNAVEGEMFEMVGSVPVVYMGTFATETQNEYIAWVGSQVDADTMMFILGSDILSRSVARLEKMSAAELEEYVENGGKLGALCAYNLNFEKANDGNYYHTEAGLEDVLANDYKTSLIRKYLNYTGSNKVNKFGGTSEASNFVTDLNIDVENDAVYEAIIARDLSDLYADINLDETAVAVPEVTVEGLATDSDKFWLLSEDEITGSETKWLVDGAVNDVENYYWLRGSYADLSNGSAAVRSDGSHGYNTIDTLYMGVRVAFYAPMP